MSMPLPCDTASERAFGRHTITTGMPMRSSPVTLATRVMPILAITERMPAMVWDGWTTR